MRQCNDPRIVAMNHRMQSDCVIHVRIDRGIVLNHISVEVKGAYVHGTQGAE